ncbi:MAG TPA: acyl-CoA dehydrogenase family protein [Euzebya sp.]|nr:acyl-CoA dehydrogenase family protein [Euzebya sp.]
MTARIDATLDGGCRQLRHDVLAFAESLRGDVAHADREESFDAEAWDRCAAFGLMGLPIAREHGGGARDLVATVVALEALGEGCADNGLAFAIGAHLWACTMPVLEFGTGDQHRRHLRGLVSGRTIAGHAASEADAGSDIFAMRTTAVRHGDTYVLDGTKRYVTNAPVADLLLVFANTDPQGRRSGLTGFLIDPSQPGVTVSAPVSKMGMRSALMGEVVLDGCEVDAGDRLGEEGAGPAIFNAGMEWERAFIMAPAVGAMQRVLTRTIDHARTRQQFGRPIGDFQAVSHQIAEMQRAVETSRALLHRTAHHKDLGRRIAADAALVKLHLSESWVSVTSAALQLHGASGYLTDTGIERDVRDALGSRIYSGTSEIQRDVIARYLGL